MLGNVGFSNQNRDAKKQVEETSWNAKNIAELCKDVDKKWRYMVDFSFNGQF